MSKTLAGVLGALALCIAPFTVPAVQAAQLSLSDLFYAGSGPDLDIKLDVDVVGSNAEFTISNDSTGTASGSSVFNAYFQSGLSSLLGSVSGAANGTADPTGTVTFTGGVGATVSPDAPPGVGDWTSNYAAWGKTGAASTGINAGESWTIAFALLDSSTTAQDIADAILAPDGQSRVALHIGSCYYGNSCTTGPSEIPIPAAIWLMLSGMVGLIGFGMVRRRSDTA